MEKYSGWRDPGTGIHPFLPPKALRQDGSAFKSILFILKYYIIGLVLGIAKLVILLPIITVLILILTLPAFTLPSIGFLWNRAVYALFGRLFLSVCGFWYIDTATVSKQKNSSIAAKRRNESAKRQISPSQPQTDLIISNHCSYFDVLYFEFRFAPVFLAVFDDGRVSPVSFCSFLNSIDPSNIGYTPNPGENKALSLSEYLQLHQSQYRTRPIVLFPEGTTSNGRGLLKFQPVLHDASFIQQLTQSNSIRLRIIGLKYIYEDWCPCYTVGGIKSHFFWSLVQFYNTLQVKELASKDVEKLVNGISDKAEMQGEDEMGNLLSAALAQLLRLRKTSKNAADKQAFVEYYHQRESQSYDKKKKKA